MTRWLVLGMCAWLLAAACGDDDESPGPGARDEDGGDEPDRDGGGGAERDGGGQAGQGGKGGSAGSGPARSDGGPGGGDDVEVIDLGEDLGEPEPLAKWTVFVYGHADHNLSNSFVRDMIEMARADLSADVNVIVLADFDASQELADTGQRFPSGAEWVRIPGGSAEPESLALEDELDFDDPAVLGGAVATVFSQFPAEHRAVILWDHGGSWSGGFGGDSQDGTRARPTPMSPAEVAAAVAAGARAAKLDGEPPLDIFSFDTCLMAGAEVAWVFRDLARVYIANAEIDYGDGWDYERFLTHLAAHADDPVIELAKTEVQLWDEHHATAGFNDALLRSHVAVDSSKLPALADAVGAVVDGWMQSSGANGAGLARAAYFSLPPYMNQLEDPQSAPELRDLGQFLRALDGVSDAELATAAATARTALQNAVIARSQGDLRNVAKQLGLHVELPLAASSTQDLFDAYDALAAGWSDASRWGEALRANARANDGETPDLTVAISNAESPDAAHLPTVEFTVPAADVAEVELELAALDTSSNDQLVFFGVLAKSAIDAGTTYDFAWNGQLTALPDGQGGQQAIYVSIWEDVGPDATGTTAPVLASFGMLETSDGSTALGALLFQDGDAETGLLTLLDPPVTLSLAEIARDLPGSTFTPVLVSLTVSTEEQALVSGSPIPIDGSPIPLSQGPAGAGAYALVTSVYDVFGNATADIQVIEVTTPISGQ